MHTVEGNGTLKQTATYNVRLRADIRRVRYIIHFPPTFTRKSRGVSSTADSTYTYECSGSFTVGGATESWSGSGFVPWGNPINEGHFFVGRWVIDDRHLSLEFDVNSKSRKVTRTAPGFSETTNEALFSPVLTDSDLDLSISVELDETGNIIGNTLTHFDLLGGSGLHTLKWSLIQNQYPPSPDSPR
jgi:hypothetical protein